MTKPSVRKKQHRIPTPDYLANVAVFYLSRFAASESSLRQVLVNRIRRAALANPAFAENSEAQKNLHEAIDKIIQKHVESGVLNDEAFARLKTNSLRRSGNSRRVITNKLQQKGINTDLISKALEPEYDDQTPEQAEETAARLFAKKRGFLKKELTQDSRRKAIASFARAGFSYGIANKIIGIDANNTDETAPVFDSFD